MKTYQKMILYGSLLFAPLSQGAAQEKPNPVPNKIYFAGQMITPSPDSLYFAGKMVQPGHFQHNFFNPDKYFFSLRTNQGIIRFNTWGEQSTLISSMLSVSDSVELRVGISPWNKDQKTDFPINLNDIVTIGNRPVVK